MKYEKLPYNPSDLEEQQVRQSDLMTDLWYKGKEVKVKRDEQIQRVLPLAARGVHLREVHPGVRLCQ